MNMDFHYNPVFVALSILVAVMASYVALDLARSVTQAKGRAQAAWLAGGAVVMGLGIWSMHFVGMLAFEMPGMRMAYDVPLMLLSIVIAIGGSALALYVVSRPVVVNGSFVAGGIAMAAAICGMHYTGMYSMRMNAWIRWNPFLVCLSVAVALVASFAALWIAIRLRDVFERLTQAAASVLMGLAIAGMHYTGMAAATFVHKRGDADFAGHLLASSGLTYAIFIATVLLLGLALLGSFIDRAFARRVQKTEETAILFQDAKLAISELRRERELRQWFVSSLVHDLRTPITAAKMSAQLSQRKARDPEQVEKFAQRIVDSLDRADQMIQNMLDAHRVSAGQALPLERERCEARPFLRKILDDLTTVHGDRFILHCAEGIEGEWDLKYLRRAVENLCTNAVKYGRPGTPIAVAAEAAGSRVVITVRNRGDTIPAHELENLFRLFHRGSDARSTGQKGWGLGLTIVKGVAEAHGGTARVTSDDENGTVFTLELPGHAIAGPHAARALGEPPQLSIS